MRKTIIATAALLCFTGMNVAMAQTCAAPGSWQPNEAGDPVVTGDTCAGSSDSVALYCGSLNSTGKNDAVYQVNFANPHTATTVTLAGGAAGFDPVAFLYSGGCATGDGCVASGDAGTAMEVTAVNPGTYFLAVSAAPPNAAGACGGFTLTANGTFPVSLQSFSIE